MNPFKLSDRDLIRSADIVICSYMPPNFEVAAARLGFLMSQIATLNQHFKDQHILLVASNWSEDAKKILNRYKLRFSAIFKKHRLFKAEIHNLVIRELNRKTGAKAVLILGDDVVPTKMDGIKRNPFTVIKKWFKHPVTMPAECVFFSCKGTLRDTYYTARMQHDNYNRFSPTAAVTDWAFMVRNDFDCIVEEDDIYASGHRNESAIPDPFQFNSDAILRFAAAHKGLEVLKDQEVFFQTFQSTSSDKNSVWYATREQRREGVKLTDLYVQYRWPWLFSQSKAKQPIWMVRGNLREQLLMQGLLIETKYGCVPNGIALQKRFEKRKMQKNSLSDLL